MGGQQRTEVVLENSEERGPHQIMPHRTVNPRCKKPNYVTLKKTFRRIGIFSFFHLCCLKDVQTHQKAMHHFLKTRFHYI
jgi:hypothetical protein